QDDKGWDARKRAYCLKIQPATGSFARNLIYSTKPLIILLTHHGFAAIPPGTGKKISLMRMKLFMAIIKIMF
ncbi:hypothetical protein, partial [Escherichia coli]|uniref:hypothetical protein n=1 Tax=Escherichia coli TaxID=562 RepID=UPI003DA06E57